MDLHIAVQASIICRGSDGGHPNAQLVDIMLCLIILFFANIHHRLRTNAGQQRIYTHTPNMIDMHDDDASRVAFCKHSLNVATLTCGLMKYECLLYSRYMCNGTGYIKIYSFDVVVVVVCLLVVVGRRHLTHNITVDNYYYYRENFRPKVEFSVARILSRLNG